MQLFYNADINEQTDILFFDREESKHIIKVMRKIAGDKLFVTNGLGKLFETEIVLGSDTKCSVKIVNVTTTEKSKHFLHLVVAPTKLNDRYEWFLEKATEIGVQEITPIICDRSERKFVKTDRFDKIILSAMKQSAQTFLPKLNKPISLKDFLKKEITGQKFIAHCIEDHKILFKNVLSQKENITILIGPEGDFSTDEVGMAIVQKFIPISLGKNRLRTETAAVVACHTVALFNENQ
jgi:16S rRNA (uracil1498-N3)-methyltransferase